MGLFVCNVYNVCLTVSSEVASNPSFAAVWGKKLIIALVIGLIIGGIYALTLKSQLTSVYKNNTAADYTRENSFKVETSRDVFIYSKTEKKEKPKENK